MVTGNSYYTCQPRAILVTSLYKVWWGDGMCGQEDFWFSCRLLQDGFESFFFCVIDISSYNLAYLQFFFVPLQAVLQSKINIQKLPMRWCMAVGCFVRR